MEINAMTLKQQAALEVAKLLALSITIGIGTGMLLNYVSLTILGIGAVTIMSVILIKWLYEIKLSQLEAKEKFKNFP